MPFKTKGIYARKINPEKELENYKPTKLGSLWKATIGEKEEAFYEIVWFAEDYQYFEKKEKKYCADYSNMTGEIFDLADWQKNRGSSYAKYKNVIFDGYKFEFGDKEVVFSGYINDDLLYLTITNPKTKESISKKLRYIPWI